MRMHNIGPNLVDRNGNSLLSIASKVGSYEIARHLLEQGADPNFANVSAEC